MSDENNKHMLYINALYEAAMQFETYRISHAAKGTPDADTKAATNERMRDRMFAAMGQKAPTQHGLPLIHASPAALVAMAKDGRIAVMLESYMKEATPIPLILEDGA